MQSLYQRDNINYGSLIDAAIKNRIDTIKREKAYRDQMIKGIQQGIGVLGRFADEKWGGNMTDAEIEREKLIKENEDIYNSYSDYMSDSNSTGRDHWTNQMQGYKPAGRSIYSDEQTSAYDEIFGGGGYGPYYGPTLDEIYNYYRPNRNYNVYEEPEDEEPEDEEPEVL